MHVIVLGGGVVGVTTAYYLAENGCTVTVVDRASDVALGTSFANGGQLSYSFTDALAKPGFIATLPALLSGRDPGSRVKLSPALLSWGMRFLAQCTSRRAATNTLDVLSLAMRSEQLLDELRDKTSFDFSYRPAGKLVLLADNEQLAVARRGTELKQAHGCDVELLTREQAIAHEPALAHLQRPFVGAVFSASDEVADAQLFCRGLRDYLAASGRVTFAFDQNIENLTIDNRQVSGISGDNDMQGDAVVVCLGAWSAELLRPAGLNPHIYPVRGYSVTLPLGENPPSVSVSSLADKIVFSRLNGNMRIAGFADFADFNAADDTSRTDTLLTIAKQVAPQAADYTVENTHRWGGFRPMTPDGQPLVGATRIKNLYLNTGHGMLGWTLACASAFDVTQAILKAH